MSGRPSLVPFEGIAYVRKWGAIGILTGLLAGGGALALLALIQLFTSVLLVGAAGYQAPAPPGEGAGALSVAEAARPWALPLIGAAVALLGGVLILKFAPEAAGVGTDAAIAAFHSGSDVAPRSAVVKALTSALTLGGGLTSGREGPIAQIGAACGCAAGRLFQLGPRERNIALAVGLGAGIAAIFRAPLAGAILAAEVFYRDDFEVEAFFPSLVASVTSYTLVGYAYGFRPIFDVGALSGAYNTPLALIAFAALGVACAAGARLLMALFRETQRRARKRPFLLAVTVGGFSTGTIALVFPTVIGTGYGWVQLAIAQGGAAMPHAGLMGGSATLLPLMLVAVAVAEMVAVSLSIGTGNAGGVFGPSIVTGGFLGAAFGSWSILLLPGVGLGMAGFVIVGMAAFFAAAAKSPLATIVMIAEMTGGYALLVPSMVAVFTAFVLSGNSSIFSSQVRTRLESPSHADEFAPFVLRKRKVREVMAAPQVVAAPDWTVERALEAVTGTRARGAVVLEGGKLRGVLARADALSVPPADRSRVAVGDIMATELVTAAPTEDLFSALERMLTKDVGMLPVVEPAAPGDVLGVITRREVGVAIANEQERLRRAPAPSPGRLGARKLSSWIGLRR